MPLTDTAIRATKPKDKPYKLHDEKGLFLIITPNGSRLWRQKCRVDGVGPDGKPKRVEKLLSHGSYPDVGLKQARQMRDEARAIRASGQDPAEKRKRDKAAARASAANTFTSVAEKLLAKQAREGLAGATLSKRRWFLKILGPAFGRRPIADIQPYDVLEAVRPIEAKGKLESARRTLNFIGQVFRYGVACQLVASDPTRDLGGALTAPRPKHHAALIDPVAVGGLLRAIDGYSGQPTTQIALALSPHLFVRPGELRRAEWSEIDLDAAVWRVSAEKMKMRQEHVVPLSLQAIALLRQIKPLTGRGRYVFPSLRSGANPMSENTVNAALRRLGYTGNEMTAHGFRAMASTLLNESGRWHPDAIERALAHKDKDAVRATYARGAFWDERVAMAQWWSDYLDGLRESCTTSSRPRCRAEEK